MTDGRADEPAKSSRATVRKRDNSGCDERCRPAEGLVITISDESAMSPVISIALVVPLWEVGLGTRRSAQRARLMVG